MKRGAFCGEMQNQQIRRWLTFGLQNGILSEQNPNV
jgi:hypothetical protein